MPFQKETLRDFAEFECERQLLINLGEDDPRWLKEPIKVIHDEDFSAFMVSHQLKMLGSKFEQEIYRGLIKSPNTRCNKSDNGFVKPFSVNADIFKIYRSELKEKEYLLLLEHDFTIPDEFYIWLFSQEQNENIPILKYETGKKRFRPDIIILEKAKKGMVKVNIDGTSEQLKDFNNKIAIDIFDIKLANERYINKKHFIELLYYGIVMNYFLKINNLDDYFFVNASLLGILPNDPDPFYFTDKEIIKNSVLMDWESSKVIFDRVKSIITQLNKKKPIARNLDECSVHFQVKCSLCPFLLDCLETLKIGDKYPPSEWNIRSIPYSNPTDADQLDEYGIESLSDFLMSYSQIPIGRIPKPIYAQLPLLALRAESLINDSFIPASSEITSSIAVPITSELSTTFTLEQDPNYDIIYSSAVNFSCRIKIENRFGQSLYYWWTLWKDVMDSSVSVTQAIDRYIFERNSIISEIPYNDNILPIPTENVFKRFEELLKEIKKRSNVDIGSLQFENEDDEESEKTLEAKFEYVYVSGSLSPTGEYELLKDFIIYISRIINIFLITENYVYDYSSQKFNLIRSCFYYWDEKIMQNFSEALERHLVQLTTDPDLIEHLTVVFNFIAPIDSEVQTPLSKNKFFDLHQFIMTTLGIPLKVKYSWHKYYEKLTTYKSSKKYWHQFKNELNFLEWHRYLLEQNSIEKEEYLKELKLQLLRKVRRLQVIRKSIQKNREIFNLISTRQIVPSTSKFVNRTLNNADRFHQTLFNFAFLNGRLKEYDSLLQQLIFPDIAIGKLEAGKVSHLVQIWYRKARAIKNRPPSDRFIYSFSLNNLSINMKIQEGDFALILPNRIRNQFIFDNDYRILIKRKIWNGQNQIFHIETEETNLDLQSLLNVNDLINEEIYIYKFEKDYWTDKIRPYLDKNSWLANHFMYRQGLGNEKFESKT